VSLPHKVAHSAAIWAEQRQSRSLQLFTAARLPLLPTHSLSHQHLWLSLTPEFQPIAVAVSNPLPLMLPLWLLTKAHQRMLLIAAAAQRSRVCDGL
jgi:hypothetical protein